MKMIFLDSFQVRNLLGDMDFNLIHGPNLSFHSPWYIPPGEIWIEKRVKKENGFLIKTEKLEKYYDKKFNNYQKARKKTADILLSKKSSEFTLKAEKRGGLIIKIVNGEIVRKTLDQSFVSGGHGLVYPEYIPKNEIWLDGKMDPKELKYILVHEKFEYDLMKKGMGYLRAHERACIAEKNSRIKDKVAFYPMKNLLRPLPLITFGRGKKRILIISGIHGNEPSGPYGIIKFLLDKKRTDSLSKKFSFLILPLINQYGFEAKTRNDKNGKDLNRWFFDKPKKGEPEECKKIKKFFGGIKKPYDLLISLHEDFNGKGFYLYDNGNGKNSPLIKSVFRAVKKADAGLYNGQDDLEISRDFIKNGYLEIKKDNECPAIEDYLERKRKIKKSITLEIPGKLKLNKKIDLVKSILENVLK